MTLASDVAATWADAAALTGAFYGSVDGSRGGEGWFASMSWQPHGELNVCGLDATADDTSARELVSVVGADQPALVFTSQSAPDSARRVLLDVGFEVAPTPEPVMLSRISPDPVAGPFTIRQCVDSADLISALALTAEAHQVPRELLAISIGTVAEDGRASVWLAESEGEPVSTVWLARQNSCIGVMEMMTPPRYQGRGAGRALLSHALNAEWDDSVGRAVLLGTPAGRRLYESLGFVAVDESLTCIRGLGQEVLDAIGQPTAPPGH